MLEKQSIVHSDLINFKTHAVAFLLQKGIGDYFIQRSMDSVQRQ
jgi:hypothetical protein